MFDNTTEIDNLHEADDPLLAAESDTPTEQLAQPLLGQRLALVGELAGCTWREFHDLVLEAGGTVAAEPDATTTWVIVPSSTSPLMTHPSEQQLANILSPAIRQAIDEGHIRVSDEHALWEQLQLAAPDAQVHQLYTPAQLAELFELPLTTIRRWQRRGWIVPKLTIKRLPYFDFSEVSTARQLTTLLRQGLTPQELERRLAEWSKYLPSAQRTLSQLALIVQHKQVLQRTDHGLQGPNGQLYFDFDSTASSSAQPADSAETESDAAAILAFPTQPEPSNLTEPDLANAPVEVLLEMAAEMEDLHDLPAAADLYRLVMSQQGPLPEVCFSLADVLYRLGDLTAARERYSMAIELNEEYVEARANLGCVLAELGDRELAIAAFEGALRYHPDYADVHFQLARVLMDAQQFAQASEHWQRCIALAPEHHWLAEAQQQLHECQVRLSAQN